MPYKVVSVWEAPHAGIKDATTLIEDAIVAYVSDGWELASVTPINSSPVYHVDATMQTSTPRHTLRGAILVFKSSAPSEKREDGGKSASDYWDDFSAAMYGTSFAVNALIEDGHFTGTVADARDALERGGLARCIKCGEWHCHDDGGRQYEQDGIRDQARFDASRVSLLRCNTCFPEVWEEAMRFEQFWNEAVDTLITAGFSSKFACDYPTRVRLKSLYDQGILSPEVAAHFPK